MRIWPAIPIILAAWAAPLVGLAFADDPPLQKPRDYRDNVIAALQVQRNQSLDAVASLNATLVLRHDEIDSLTEQLKASDEKVKKLLDEKLELAKQCNAPDSKDH